MNNRISDLARTLGVHPEVARDAVAATAMHERIRQDIAEQNRAACDEAGAMLDVTERPDRFEVL